MEHTAERTLPLRTRSTREKLVVLINPTGWTATAPPMKTAAETRDTAGTLPRATGGGVLQPAVDLRRVLEGDIAVHDPNTYRRSVRQQAGEGGGTAGFRHAPRREDLRRDRSNASTRAFGDKMRVFDARKAAVLKAKRGGDRVFGLL